MNIGIVTQPLWGNYGGILQNYALQQVLIKSGHNPVTLDYLWGDSGGRYVINQLKNILLFLAGKSKKTFITYAPGRPSDRNAAFIEKHIRTTHTFWNSYKPQLVQQYRLDAVIVGSDQVWRPRYNPCLQDSFLSFSQGQPIKRIAYAASFGTSEWEYTTKQQLMCASLLQSFDYISVRECSAIDILKKLGCDKGIQVLDPTLLLGRQGFDNLDSAETLPASETSLGVYILDHIENEQCTLQQIQNTLGLETIHKLGERNIGTGPVEWIANIRNSNYFVTDSFHGTVFCLLYHIPFMTVVNNERGADRFLSLLKPLGLEHRIRNILSSEELPTDTVDWTTVDRLIDLQRKKSIDFLSEALG